MPNAWTDRPKFVPLTDDEVDELSPVERERYEQRELVNAQPTATPRQQRRADKAQAKRDMKKATRSYRRKMRN